MAIYSFNEKTLQKLEATTFSAEKILEQQDLQAAIKLQIEAIAPDCLVISEEFSEWSDVKRRIDLLAVDKNANLVVIELKRTETGDHMELQALRYAAMVSTLTFARATEVYQKYLASIECEGDAETMLLDFLGWDEPQEDNFALNVRIILVSSDFSKELTTSVMWLNERNLNIRCVRWTPYKYQDQILLDIQPIIPLPEVEDYQVKIRQQSEERRKAKESSRDYTCYLFQGEKYNKRKLVLAVIRYWVDENKPQVFSELEKAFPQEARVKGGKLFVYEQAAKEKYASKRHFLSDGEILEFGIEKWAISNQWGKDNIKEFISYVKKTHKYEIEEVERD